MRRYSIFIILSFALSAAFRIADIFLVEHIWLKVLFFVILFLGVAFIALECAKNDCTVKAISYENKFRLDIFAFICACGMFVDFVVSAQGIYYCIIDSTANAMRTFLEAFQCVFALLGTVCFVLIALSYKNPKRFDFRKLGLFNLILLLWALSRCLIGLTDIYELQNTSSITMYLTLLFCLMALYCFLYETQGKAVKKFSLFSIRSFGSVGFICFVTQIVSVIHKDSSILDEQTLFVLSMYFISLFLHTLSTDVMYRQKISD